VRERERECREKGTRGVRNYIRQGESEIAAEREAVKEEERAAKRERNA
jgi:hypothetical protein